MGGSTSKGVNKQDKTAIVLLIVYIIIILLTIMVCVKDVQRFFV
jgi:hypothetical protein